MKRVDTTKDRAQPPIADKQLLLLGHTQPGRPVDTKEAVSAANFAFAACIDRPEGRRECTYETVSLASIPRCEPKFGIVRMMLYLKRAGPLLSATSTFAHTWQPAQPCNCTVQPYSPALV